MDEVRKTDKLPLVPLSILPHSKDYKNSAWMDYTLHELGMWVHLLVKRAGHRNNPLKAKKDLEDAQNYLNMMQAHIDYVAAGLEPVSKQ
jgi:hypothetical protein